MKNFLSLLIVVLALTLAISLASCELFDSKSTTATNADSQLNDPPADNHNHSYTATVTPPTCTEKVYTAYSCECGSSYVDDYIDALGHSFGDWTVIKEPSVTEAGLKERYCECGAKESEAIDKLIEVKYSEGLIFELNNDKKSYSVVGIGNCKDLDIVIPVTYESLPVTRIGYDAFYWCDAITSVTIGNSVTVIDDNAFEGCLSLVNVSIPESVISIGYRAFSNCSSLTDIIIPDSVTSIGNYAFYQCNLLTSIIIPDSVTNIGDYAFALCESLTSVEISDSVISIGYRVFYDCYSLTSIEVNENNDCYCYIDGNLYNKDATTLIQYAVGKSNTSFTIPNSVTTIGNDAFVHCISLTSIEIPTSVTSIGEYAFDSCHSLTSIIIPISVKTIDAYAFYKCSQLTIYCKTASKPSTWNSNWKSPATSAVWGYTGE